MKIKTSTIERSIGSSLMAIAAAGSIAALPEHAGAVALSFNTIDPNTPNNTTSVGGSGFSGTTSNVVQYLNVASIAGANIDARITLSPFGTNYSVDGNVTNYTSAGSSSGDAGFVYSASNYGIGGMTYKLDFFVADAGHTFSNVATPFDFSLLVYDVDGEDRINPTTGVRTTQTEWLRIAKGVGATGLDSFQVGTGNTINANGQTVLPVTVTENTDDYLFKGGGINAAETTVQGDVILNFKQLNTITLQFEANTIRGALPNGVFSAIDGDSSILPKTTGTFDSAVTANKKNSVPEPFTVIGTLLGGAAAVGMKKKLQVAKQD